MKMSFEMTSFGDDWQGQITLRTTDDEGLTAIDTAEIIINNIAPSAEAGANQEVFAGDVVQFNASFTDPGWLDTHTIKWDMGDETILTDYQLNPSYVYYNQGTYLVTLTVTDDDGGVGIDTLEITVKPIPAAVNCDPDALNLKSKGKWITCYIELPSGYDVRQIDGSKISLNGIPAYLGKEGWAKAEANESNIIDSDKDQILERMVKFDRQSIQEILQAGEANLIIAGKLFYNQGWADFEGIDKIKITKLIKLKPKLAT